MAKVSIVVPIYNVENYLKRNLTSLMNQTYQDIEILCVNDGATDGSPEVIDEFVKMDQRFVRLDKVNGGLSDARNHGMKAASGEYIMFIDSDDFVSEKMVETCLRKMEADQLDMVVFDYDQYFDVSNTSEKISMPFSDQQIFNLDNCPELVAYCNNAAWNKMYRTSLFIENSITYPFGYRHQDLGTTFRLLTYCKRIGFIHESLYFYLADRPNNISQMIDSKLYHIVDMCTVNVEFYKEKGIFEKYKEELKYLCMINFMVALRKAMKLTDREFVMSFVDQVFDYMEFHFGSLQWNKYSPAVTKSDKIYLSRWLTKMYYLVKRCRK